jgi:hypothetical protein
MSKAANDRLALPMVAVELNCNLWPPFLLSPAKDADDDEAIVLSVDFVDDHIRVGAHHPFESILRLAPWPM